MSDLSEKSVDELIEIIEQKQETIDQLEQAVEEANEQCEEYETENEEMISNTLDQQEQEELAVKCFYGGFDCADTDKSKEALKLKSWLNFKMEERL